MTCQSFFPDNVEYFEIIDAVHYWGRYEQWIKFFLETIKVATETTLRRVELIINLRNQHLSRIRSEDKDVQYLLEAYPHIEKHVFLDTASLAEAIGVSYNTGARIMDKLVTVFVIRRSKSRIRVFVIGEIIKYELYLPSESDLLKEIKEIINHSADKENE